MSNYAPLPVVLVASFVLGAITAAPRVARADQPRDRVARPSVPANLEVDAEFRPYLYLHADGTQNYLCQATATGVAWAFLGPQATLFDDDLDQVVTHYLSPNPEERDLPRAAWRHSRDTSTVWAMAVEQSSDPDWVASGAIPWLKLKVAGAQLGPDGGRRLALTRFIQRVNTAGGVAPSTGCTATTDVGRRAFVPYATDYVFYR
jgi:Protein of unknown function (DUF3455)